MPATVTPYTPAVAAEVLRRLEAHRPMLEANAAWGEENRRLHPETVEALAEAGVFRLRTPARFGGLEAGTADLVEVASALAEVDRAAAWVASVYWIPTWMAAQFPAPVQEEVFATENVRVCGTLSPTAFATPTDGGVVVNGKWGFISGAHHAHWQEIIAIRTGPGDVPYPIAALVPRSELLVVDDWQTQALRGSGSVSVAAKDLFVPAERVLPLPVLLEGEGADSTGPGLYRNPLLPVASASSVGTVLGIARAAMATFVRRLGDRKITYTDYASQREAPLTHHQVAEAACAIDEASFHATRLAELVDTKAAGGSGWKLEERALARGAMGATVRRATQATEILAAASGGSSIYADVPVQSMLRDVQAVNLHALMHPATNAELYGRVLCGLEPNSQYI